MSVIFWKTRCYIQTLFSEMSFSCCFFFYSKSLTEQERKRGRESKEKRGKQEKTKLSVSATEKLSDVPAFCPQRFGQVPRNREKTSRRMNEHMDQHERTDGRTDAFQKHNVEWRRQVATLLHCLAIDVMFKSTGNISASWLLIQL